MNNTDQNAVADPLSTGRTGLGIHLQPNPNRLRCRVVRTDSGLADLEADWRALSVNSVGNSPFKSWEWASTWWRYFSAPGTFGKSLRALYVVVVEDAENGSVQGIMPLHYNVESKLSLKARYMELFGARGIDKTFNEDPILLLCRGREHTVLYAALEHMYGCDCAVEWDFLWITVNGPPAYPLLTGPPSAVAARRVRQVVWEQKSYAGDLTVRFGADWDAYRRRLSAPMRRTTARYSNRLAKHGRMVSVRYVTEPGELTRAIDLLVDMHAQRATGSRGKAHSNHIPGRIHRDMLQEMLCAFARTDSAFVAVLEIDGAPAAVQAFLRQDDSLVLYYSGYDLALYEYSPLTVLLVDVIRKSMADGCRRLNFLHGEIAWKDRWGPEPESLFQNLFCTSGSPRANLLASMRRSLQWARSKFGYAQ
jgi:CelD/BcsL family acetyltransferase involved in cellulose biosynthesis